MQDRILEINNLSVGFGEIRVLHGVSVHLCEQERIGLFGPNGHGKTTLLRAVSGLIKPSEGEIRFMGEPITGLSPKAVVNRGLIHVSQGNSLFPRMTVLENLHFAAC